MTGFISKFTALFDSYTNLTNAAVPSSDGYRARIEFHARGVLAHALCRSRQAERVGFLYRTVLPRYDFFANHPWLLLPLLAMPVVAGPHERLLCVWASTAIMIVG